MKNITLRAEWVVAALALPTEAKHAVLEAIMAYMVDGYVCEIADSQALEVFAIIKADIDAREAKRQERRAKRGDKAAPAQTAKIKPGYLPQEPPADLEQRVKADPVVAMAMNRRDVYAEFSCLEKPLLAELCLQITARWRERGDDGKLPSFLKLGEDFAELFGDAIHVLKVGPGDITRNQWRHFIECYSKPVSAH